MKTTRTWVHRTAAGPVRTTSPASVNNAPAAFVRNKAGARVHTPHEHTTSHDSVHTTRASVHSTPFSVYTTPASVQTTPASVHTTPTGLVMKPPRALGPSVLGLQTRQLSAKADKEEKQGKKGKSKAEAGGQEAGGKQERDRKGKGAAGGGGGGSVASGVEEGLEEYVLRIKELASAPAGCTVLLSKAELEGLLVEGLPVGLEKEFSPDMGPASSAYPFLVRGVLRDFLHSLALHASASPLHLPPSSPLPPASALPASPAVPGSSAPPDTSTPPSSLEASASKSTSLPPTATPDFSTSSAGDAGMEQDSPSSSLLESRSADSLETKNPSQDSPSSLESKNQNHDSFSPLENTTQNRDSPSSLESATQNPIHPAEELEGGPLPQPHPGKEPLASEAPRKRSRYLLLGPSGSGKSTLLALAAAWARATGWLVLYVPRARQWARDGLYYRHPGTGPALWDTPVQAQRVLQDLLAAHEDQLRNMVVLSRASLALGEAPNLDREPQERHLPSAEEEASWSLADLAALGVKERDASVSALLRLREELEHPRPNGVPVLIAVDEYNAWFTFSSYFESTGSRSRRQIHANELRMVRAFRPMTSDARREHQAASLSLSPSATNSSPSLPASNPSSASSASSSSSSSPSSASASTSPVVMAAAFSESIAVGRLAPRLPAVPREASFPVPRLSVEESREVMLFHLLRLGMDEEEVDEGALYRTHFLAAGNAAEMKKISQLMFRHEQHVG